MAVNFFYEVSNFKLKNIRKTKNWLKDVFVFEEYRVGDINYIFCSDEELLDINQKFLSHDYFTDIITFASTVGKTASADIYISVDRAKENSGVYNVALDKEVLRLLVHGALHTMGYEDGSDAERLNMTNKENFYLDKF
jgi:probable rRNA maturation factor